MPHLTLPSVVAAPCHVDPRVTLSSEFSTPPTVGLTLPEPDFSVFPPWVSVTVTVHEPL